MSERRAGPETKLADVDPAVQGGRPLPGSPINPLLSNVYMRRFVLAWKALGHEARLHARIVNYADDFVICCRGTAQEAMTVMRDMMTALKLTVNETKTHVREVPVETFDFLGYTFGLHWTNRTRRKVLCEAPSKKRIARVCERISAITDRKRGGLAPEVVVAELNRVLRGWARYFCLGSVSDTCRTINAHVRYRFRKWWSARHKPRNLGPCRYWSPWWEQTFDLRVTPAPLGPLPLAGCESVNLLREPDAGNPHVRFDERGLETEQGTAREALATERVGNSQAASKPPRQTSTLPGGTAPFRGLRTPVPAMRQQREARTPP